VATMIPRIKQLDEKETQRRADRAAARKLKTKPTIALDSLGGTYSDKIYGNATITVKGGVATLSLLPAPELFTGTLEHWHYDTWKWNHADPFLEPGYVTFNFDADHRITDYKIDLHSPDFHFGKLDFVRE